MKKVAIYARKSNDDNDRAKEDKSVSAQIDEARRYAKKKGWQVCEEHIYSDDGISGAEFENRPGFARLLAALPKRGSRAEQPFDVLVMSELSRLGRDMRRTPFYVAEILDSNVAIWCYLNDTEERGDNAEQNLMTSVRAYSDEAYRIRTAERVRSRLRRMAEQGLVTGGCVFGYKSEDVFGAAANGEHVRTHSVWRIDEAEAEIIRAIFKMYVDGYGHASIAKALNADPRPRYAPLSRRYFHGKRVSGPRNGGGTWAASSVREILHRDRYTGKLRYGKMRSAWKRGTKERRPSAEQNVVVERPELRIVSDALWREAQSRIASMKKTYAGSTGGRMWGRPGMGTESRYLLTGLGRCGACGGNITAVGGFPGKAHRKPIYYYGCSWFANKGVSACPNRTRLRMERADEVVRDAMKRAALTPEAVERILNLAEEMLAKHRLAIPERPENIEGELRKAKAKHQNLLSLAEQGKAPASVLERIAALDSEVAALALRLADCGKVVPLELDRARLRKALRQRLNEFDDLIYSDIPLARQALRKLLDGPITFEAAPEGYLLKGRTRIGALLPKGYIEMVPRKGLEPPQCCHR